MSSACGKPIGNFLSDSCIEMSGAHGPEAVISEQTAKAAIDEMRGIGMDEFEDLPLFAAEEILDQLKGSGRIYFEDTGDISRNCSLELEVGKLAEIIDSGTLSDSPFKTCGDVFLLIAIHAHEARVRHQISSFYSDSFKDLPYPVADDFSGDGIADAMRVLEVGNFPYPQEIYAVSEVGGELHKARSSMCANCAAKVAGWASNITGGQTIGKGILVDIESSDVSAFSVSESREYLFVYEWSAMDIPPANRPDILKLAWGEEEVDAKTALIFQRQGSQLWEKATVGGKKGIRPFFPNTNLDLLNYVRKKSLPERYLPHSFLGAVSQF